MSGGGRFSAVFDSNNDGRKTFSAILNSVKAWGKSFSDGVKTFSKPKTVLVQL
jgi:hypothetical protein